VAVPRVDVVVDGVSRRFGTRQAVHEASFTVEPGEVLGLLGPNGAGKTTLLRLLCGYLQPDEGTVRVGGADVIREPVLARSRIGYVPEGAPVPGDATARGYLTYCARLRCTPRRQRRPSVDAVLRRAGLLDVADIPIGSLSRGVRQRVAIAQALVGDPPVLVLDEPTTGLDPRQVTEARELIGRLGRHHSVILSSHLLPEVAQLCRRVVVLDAGRIVAAGPVADLTAAGTASRLEIRVDGDQLVARETVAAVAGVTAVATRGSLLVVEGDGADLPARVAAALVGAGLGLVELRRVSGSLEDAYLRLVGG